VFGVLAIVDIVPFLTLLIYLVATFFLLFSTQKALRGLAIGCMSAQQLRGEEEAMSQQKEGKPTKVKPKDQINTTVA